MFGALKNSTQNFMKAPLLPGTGYMKQRMLLPSNIGQSMRGSNSRFNSFGVNSLNATSQKFFNS